MFSIIVPIYKRSDLTITFVRQISNYLQNPDLPGELILVDNDPEFRLIDETLEVNSKFFPTAKIKHLQHKPYENLWFGGANNFGVKYTDKEKIGRAHV